MSIGTGSVTVDGTVIKSDPGVGIVKAGWNLVQPPEEPASTLSIDMPCNAPIPKLADVAPETWFNDTVNYLDTHPMPGPIGEVLQKAVDRALPRSGSGQVGIVYQAGALICDGKVAQGCYDPNKDRITFTTFLSEGISKSMGMELITYELFHALNRQELLYGGADSNSDVDQIADSLEMALFGTLERVTTDDDISNEIPGLSGEFGRIQAVYQCHEGGASP